jgi:hypothetical protein
MDPNAVLTFGLGGLIVVVFLAGVSVVEWLRRQLEAERRSTLETVQVALKPLTEALERLAENSAEELKQVTSEVREAAAKLTAHELYSERTFMSKHTGQLLIESIRADFKESRAELLMRLSRIEGFSKTAAEGVAHP